MYQCHRIEGSTPLHYEFHNNIWLELSAPLKLLIVLNIKRIRLHGLQTVCIIRLSKLANKILPHRENPFTDPDEASTHQCKVSQRRRTLKPMVHESSRKTGDDKSIAALASPGWTTLRAEDCSHWLLGALCAHAHRQWQLCTRMLFYGGSQTDQTVCSYKNSS